MRKIILNLAVSLDGFIEGPNGEFDWCYTDLDYGMTEFLNRTDAILFGRKSYEVLLQYDASAYPDKKKYVISKSLTSVNDPSVQLISNAVEEIKLLKSGTGKDIWLWGGAELISTLMNEKLVDELQISVHPILLGSGKALFSGLKERMYFNHKETINYSSGLVQLIYTLNTTTA